MNISGAPSFDFRNPKLIKFVQNATIGDQSDVQRTQQSGFHTAGIPPIKLEGIKLPGGKPVVVPWTLIQRWAIDEYRGSNPQRIQTFTVETVASREVEAILCVGLEIKNGVAEDVEKTICDRFSAYHFPTSGDLDTYVENCLKDLPGLSPYAFGLVYFYQVSVTQDAKIDQNAIDRVRYQIGGNENYRLHMISESILDSFRDNPPHPNIEDGRDVGATVGHVAEKKPALW